MVVICFDDQNHRPNLSAFGLFALLIKLNYAWHYSIPVLCLTLFLSLSFLTLMWICINVNRKSMPPNHHYYYNENEKSISQHWTNGYDGKPNDNLVRVRDLLYSGNISSSIRPPSTADSVT